LKLEGARVLVVGMARSGLAAVSLLSVHGAKVSGTDKNPILEGSDITRRLDEIYSEESDGLDQDIARLQALSLPEDDW
jgi:UDP-N-acetylmuramoylalanine-D-glutamate ligase